jgi:hypothetical protein
VLSRLIGFRSVPARIRAMTAAALVGLTGLVTVGGLGVWEADEGLRILGQSDGPTVVATSDAYLALSDMDVQVTNVLLSGREAGWLCEPQRTNLSETASDQEQREERAARGDGADPGEPRDGRTRAASANGGCDRELPRELYEIRREDAQGAALKAAELANGDPVRLKTVQAVLDGLHQYDRRVQAAMEYGRRAAHPVGEPPADAVAEYRAATSLMTDSLLPQAHNLNLHSEGMVNATYQDKRVRVGYARMGVVVAGLIAVAALLGLQGYFWARFRRTMNPFLAVATLGIVILTIASASLLSTGTERLRAAKADGFDPVLTLSRTQATGKSLEADRGRCLLDEENADRYDQTYLHKSQSMLYIPSATSLAVYYLALDQQVGRYQDGESPAKLGGLYGQEARRDRAAIGGLLARYRDYQRMDEKIRRLAAAGRPAAAARARMDPDPDLSYLPHTTFREHDGALGALISKRRNVLDQAVATGHAELEVWAWLLPAAVPVAAGLIIAGVWRRLAEFR